MRRRLPLVFAIVLGLVACGPGPEVEAPPQAAQQPASIAGSYEMEGMTVEKESGAKRKISGTIVMAQEGSQYTASFHLTTTYPTGDGPLPADVIGSSEGTIEGSKLEGSARTQLMMATVPGVDPQFAFVPRWVGPRLVSKASGQIAADGTLTLETENEPAEGEQYPPTRTTLRGKRLPPEATPPQAHD
jgi:hypothetical protein